MILAFGATFVVADPLGREAGDRATEVALRVVRHAIEAGKDAVTAIVDANRAVLEEQALSGGGCTMAIVQADGPELVVIWIGDVRVYRLRGEDVECLTRDHSLVNDYASKHALTPTQLAGFPHKNVIVRALGIADAQPDQVRDARAPGDVVLLATDGVYSALGETLLAQSLRVHGHDPKACVRELLDNASANGGGGSAYVIPDHTFESGR
jgi:protein phosphatase